MRITWHLFAITTKANAWIWLYFRSYMCLELIMLTPSTNSASMYDFKSCESSLLLRVAKKTATQTQREREGETLQTTSLQSIGLTVLAHQNSWSFSRDCALWRVIWGYSATSWCPLVALKLRPCCKHRYDHMLVPFYHSSSWYQQDKETESLEMRGNSKTVTELSSENSATN